MDRPTRRYLPVLVFALLVLVASLVPAPDSTGPTPMLFGIGLDKLVHAGSYGTLTTLLAWAGRRRDLAALAVGVALAVGYGTAIELLQGLVDSRSLSGVDMVANAVGASVAALAWRLVGRW